MKAMTNMITTTLKIIALSIAIVSLVVTDVTLAAKAWQLDFYVDGDSINIERYKIVRTSSDAVMLHVSQLPKICSGVAIQKGEVKYFFHSPRAIDGDSRAISVRADGEVRKILPYQPGEAILTIPESGAPIKLVRYSDSGKEVMLFDASHPVVIGGFVSNHLLGQVGIEVTPTLDLNRVDIVTRNGDHGGALQWRERDAENLSR